ncbi:hypothetical protein IAT40_005904 [Kwoniella sp. CBS 6097]
MQSDNITKPPPVYPHAWREIINGSIEENFTSIAQGTLNNLILPDFVPPPEHIQFLLYLTLNPSINDSTTPDQTLALLSKLLSTHNPSAFAHNIPYHPSTSSHNLRKDSDNLPSYLDWDYKRSDLHKNVWKCMRRCKDEGVWELLWVNTKAKKDNASTSGRGDNKRKRLSRVIVEQDDEEEDKEDKIVSERGWDLLEWLVEMWEVDRSLQQEVSYSPIFLKQIPRPYGDLQRNDAGAIMAIIKCAYSPPSSGPGISKIDYQRRKEVAARLLCLVFDTALSSSPNTESKAQSSQPPFHPPSLASSLVHLFRSLPTPSLMDLVKIVRRIEYHIPSQQIDSIPSTSTSTAGKATANESSILTLTSTRALAHVLTLCIEDLVGIRASKNEERRKLATHLKRQYQQQTQTHTHMRPNSSQAEKAHVNADQGDFQSSTGSLDIPKMEYLYRGILPLCLSPGSSTSMQRNSNQNQKMRHREGTDRRSDIDPSRLEKLERLIQFKIALLNLCLPPRPRPRPRHRAKSPVSRLLRQETGTKMKRDNSGDSQQEVEHQLLEPNSDVGGGGGAGSGDANLRYYVNIGMYDIDKERYEGLRDQLREDKDWWTKIERSVEMNLTADVTADTYSCAKRVGAHDVDDKDDELKKKKMRTQVQLLGQLLIHFIRSSLTTTTT